MKIKLLFIFKVLRSMYFKIYCAFDIRFNYHRIVKFSPGGLKMADSTGQLILFQTVTTCSFRLAVFSLDEERRSQMVSCIDKRYSNFPWYFQFLPQSLLCNVLLLCSDFFQYSVSTFNDSFSYFSSAWGRRYM